ncbi:MAG: amino acid permease [Lentisphaeria bacterium]|nr:amino acid permease [Lentisphaeria bacterium]
MKTEELNPSSGGLTRYLSTLGALALSFGYAVGWGAFVMPGTTFLPGAGPLGTVIGVLFGALAMGIFAVNYHRLTNRYSGPGGAATFAQRVFGEDHGFVVAWFLWLTYIAILWANATAMILIVRFTLGDVLQFGFHYTVAGFDVYFGEAVLAIVSILVCGGICLLSKKLAVITQIVFALILAAGVFFFFFFALAHHTGGMSAMAPAFMDDVNPVMQISRILALMPWAFVGFEAITHSSGEFRFPLKRTAAILIAAIVISTFVYLFLALLPVVTLDADHRSWIEHIRELPSLSGIRSVPVFASAEHLLGRKGVALMCTLMIAGQITGIIASIIAISRLMHAMSKSNILPKRLGELNAAGIPRNAILFIVGISCVIPFFGRTAIGWPVDVSSIGAAIAYGYTSAAAFRIRDNSEQYRHLFIKGSGVVGVLFSIFFCLLLVIPNYITGSVMAAPSYLLLAVWCILGFLLYHRVFKEGHQHRFGRSMVVWNSLVVTIIFASLMWVRQSSFESAKSTIYECMTLIAGNDGAEKEQIIEKLGSLNVSMLCSAVVEMILLLISLGILYSLISILRKRELRLASEKAKIEEMNKTKSFFFSSVSHDIRTPLNAIIGYTELLTDGIDDQDERNKALSAISTSGNTLLQLINDVLDLSKLESGKMDIKPELTDVREIISAVLHSFDVMTLNSDVELKEEFGPLPLLEVDPQRIRQILFNLIGNAVKFTEHGEIRVRASFWNKLGGGNGGVFVLSVSDTGCGIPEEAKDKLMNPFVQVDTDAKIKGTGLGLAICKQFASRMGGDLSFVSELGKGSTFTLELRNVKFAVKPPDDDKKAADVRKDIEKAKNCANALLAKQRMRNCRMLVVDDVPLNLAVLKALLTRIGLRDVVTAVDGQDAWEKIQASDKPFDLVLADMWMPKMNGRDLVAKIRADERFKDIPVYAVTADTEARKTFAKHGFTGILLKPLTIDKLSELFN